MILNDQNVKSLKDMAKEFGLKGYSSMKKAEVIELIENNTYVCQLCGERVLMTSQPDHMTENHSLHSDVPGVIDTEEFPMDHKQFTDWFNRHGGLSTFDGFKAIEADHDEALSLNTQREYTEKGKASTLRQVDIDAHFTGLNVLQRARNYHAQNDPTGRSKLLTKKQQRRVLKKYKHNLLGKGYSIEKVTGMSMA
jgi:hypothetical protein